MAAPVKVTRQQTTPELSGTWTLPPEPTPTRAGTLQNPPEPSRTFRNQPFGIFRNLLPPSVTYASIHRNPPKSSGTFRELASGTYTILHRNSPEPSGTCSCDPHRHTPELIWAEDPISLRCWRKLVYFFFRWFLTKTFQNLLQRLSNEDFLEIKRFCQIVVFYVSFWMVFPNKN